MALCDISQQIGVAFKIRPAGLSALFCKALTTIHIYSRVTPWPSGIRKLWNGVSLLSPLLPSIGNMAIQSSNILEMPLLLSASKLSSASKHSSFASIILTRNKRYLILEWNSVYGPTLPLEAENTYVVIVDCNTGFLHKWHQAVDSNWQ